MSRPTRHDIYPMKIFTLPNPTPLEKSIAKRLDKNFAQNTEWRHFSNGEWILTVPRTTKSAIVLGRTEPPGDHLLQTLTLIDTLKRNGANDITLVAPYFGYSRQDREVRTGDHLPADLFTKLFKQCGATRIITVELHSPLTKKNSPLPIVTIDPIPELVAAFKKIWKKSDGLTVVSPDHGSRHRADEFRDLLDPLIPVCWLEKHRNPKTGKVHSHELLGIKQGTTALILDDICDTGGTIQECVRHLKKNGFKTLYLCVTHPVLSGKAIPVLRALRFKRVFMLDTVPLAPNVKKLLPASVITATQLVVTALHPFE